MSALDLKPDSSRLMEANGSSIATTNQKLFHDAYDASSLMQMPKALTSDHIPKDFPTPALDTPSNTIDITRLPNGDGHVVTDAKDLKPGEIYISPETKEQTQHGQTGAVEKGLWINPDGTYDLTKKTPVEGAVQYNGKYQVTADNVNDTLTIVGNALPTTTTGEFPIDPNSEAGHIDPNPNTIQADDYSFTVPRHPKPADRPTPVGLGTIGVLNNGGLLYSSLDGKGNDANKYEIQDEHEGHPSEAERYHTHQVPPVLYENQSKTGPSPALGRALDGYPIVAAYKNDGTLYTTSELDKFHGREVEVKEEDGTVKKQWAYCVSLDYPYTIGAFKGLPAQVEGLDETPKAPPPPPPPPPPPK